MSPELKNKQQLADAADVIAQSYALVQKGVTTFIPVDWQSYSPDPPPTDGKIWLPFTREQKQQMANITSGILFANDTELRSFDFMIKQLAEPFEGKVDSILIKTPAGLRVLNSEGQLVEHDGSFTPNYVKPMLNENPEDKARVFNTIVEWLGGLEAEAHSLLNHLATSLAPGFSAVKYVLLLGEGRNGKSVLLTMLYNMYGAENISDITRQMMAERNPTCVELNDKLLNLIFDGEMAYIKDSSMEKTLIAGETGVVRLLYESGTTKVQTNALFIEALNIEPKVRDKSPALQKRLVRFHFPNVYVDDEEFFEEMTSERMVGALLSLLIDHYVKKNEKAVKLAPTQASLALQLEQVWLGSPVLQFLEHLSVTDPQALDKLAAGSFTVDAFLASFKPWAETQGIRDRNDGDLLGMLKTSFILTNKITKVNGRPINQRTISGMRPETQMALTQLKGGSNEPANITEELVGNRPV
jgi:phage/plasmid-associated DNA primase